MSILCGIDFSETSYRAAKAASHVAARMQMPLHLVHALDTGSEAVYEELGTYLIHWAERQLQRTQERLRSTGAQIQTHIKTGAPDECVLEVAEEVSAKLIVVAALGQRHPDKYPLGSHADGIAQRSHVPVLVVRNPEPFEDWAADLRPLRIVLGADSTISCENAARWINELRGLGPCELIAVHLYWPPEQFRRLGLGGIRAYDNPDPEIVAALERDLSARLSLSSGSGPIAIRIEPNIGRVGTRLADLAASEKADLIVVGTHDRSAFERLWEGSVSRDVLRRAGMSVACIPALRQSVARATSKVRNVLAATDFSPMGDAAIQLAYSIVDPSGTVHLAHMIKADGHNPIDPHDLFDASKSTTMIEIREAATKRLRGLIPVDAFEQAKDTQVHIVEANDPAEAIHQSAERLGVDVVCLGTHGRSGLSKAFLGSVAQSVFLKTRRPVLFTRGPLE